MKRRTPCFCMAATMFLVPCVCAPRAGARAWDAGDQFIGREDQEEQPTARTLPNCEVRPVAPHDRRVVADIYRAVEKKFRKV